MVSPVRIGHIPFSIFQFPIMQFVRSVRIVKSPCGPFSSSDPYGSLRALAIRRAEFTDGMLHLIRETLKNSHLPTRGQVC